MKDWLSCFWIADFLGRNCPSENTLDKFCGLLLRVSPRQKALLAMGIGCIARKSDTQHVRERALKNLKVLQEDASEEVRVEARIAIQRIGRKKSK
jgi:hypothetical protein